MNKVFRHPAFIISYFGNVPPDPEWDCAAGSGGAPELISLNNLYNSTIRGCFISHENVRECLAHSSWIIIVFLDSLGSGEGEEACQAWRA